ncbi:MAG: sulfotransferase domain-containing protein [Planctomycetota bacterium]
MTNTPDQRHAAPSFKPATSNAAIKLRSVSQRITWQLGKRMPNTFPFVFVLGYPKSGTSWMCQVIADYLNLPFPRFSILPVGCPAVVHGHQFVTRDYPAGIYSMRDGRDVMVSQYFFSLRHTKLAADGSPMLTAAQRRLHPGLQSLDDAKTNLPRMIRNLSANGHDWSAHVRSYLDTKHPRFPLLTYEDLINDGPRALATCCASLLDAEPDIERAEASIAKFSFARQKKAKAGGTSEAKFLRKGGTGDWKNHFTPETARLFDELFGRELIEAGYEPDNSWVERFEAEFAERESTPAEQATGATA